MITRQVVCHFTPFTDNRRAKALITTNEEGIEECVITFDAPQSEMQLSVWCAELQTIAGVCTQIIDSAHISLLVDYECGCLHQDGNWFNIVSFCL